MAGTTITITPGQDNLAPLTALAERLRDLSPVMRIIGETIRTSVVENFQAGGRPEAWKPLASATLSRKKGGSILIGKGFAGGLMGSINTRVDGNSVSVGTNKVYAAIHQFGGMAGRNKKVSIPARPFLMVQTADWDEIKKQLQDFIAMGR